MSGAKRSEALNNQELRARAQRAANRLRQLERDSIDTPEGLLVPLEAKHVGFIAELIHTLANRIPLPTQTPKKGFR